MTNNPTHSSQIFNDNSMLSRLINHANKLIKLNNVVQEYLPARIKDKCSICAFDNRILTLTVTSSELRTRLYYQQNTLIDKLTKHQEFLTLLKIEIKVAPNTKNDQPTVISKRIPISSTSAELIKQCAQNIEHKPLQQSLLNLAQLALQN